MAPWRILSTTSIVCGEERCLRAHLHQLSVFLLGLDEHLSFGGIVAAGLLDVDVLAGLQASDGHGRVPMVGRGDGDGVYIFVLENFAEVFSVAGTRLILAALCRRTF